MESPRGRNEGFRAHQEAVDRVRGVVEGQEVPREIDGLLMRA
jgi:hypothetical protein